MKQNKKKFINFSTCVALGSVVLMLPTLTLTSCSTISQYIIPVSTSCNPYANSKAVSDPYIKYGKYETSKSAIVGKDNVIDYLPKSYIYTSTYNNTFTSVISGVYAFTKAESYNLDYSKQEYHSNPFTFSDDLFENNRWVKINDSAYKINDSSINANTYVASNQASVVSNNLIALFNYMNTYQNKVIQQKNNDDINKMLSVMYANNQTGFNKGTIGSEQNQQFFEFCFDEANLICLGHKHYKFGPYDVKWEAKTSGVEWIQNASPFIPLENHLELPDFDYSNQENQNKKIQPFVDTYANIGTYTYDDNTKSFKYERPTLSNGLVRYFTYHYDKNGKYDDVINIANVPVLIRLNNITSGIYNPDKNRNSIYPSDWLETNINNVNNLIKNSSVWNSFKQKTNKDPQVTTLTYSQTVPQNTTNPNYTGWWKGNKRTNIDPTIKYWIDNGIIKTGDFIGFANYSLANIEYTYKNTAGQEVHFKTKVPHFTGYSSVIPAYLAFNEECYTQINESEKQNEQYKTYVLDFSDKGNLSKAFYQMINTLNGFNLPSLIGENYTSASDLFINDPLAIFKWVYNGFSDGNFIKKDAVINSQEIYNAN